MFKHFFKKNQKYYKFQLCYFQWSKVAYFNDCVTLSATLQNKNTSATVIALIKKSRALCINATLKFSELLLRYFDFK